MLTTFQIITTILLLLLGWVIIMKLRRSAGVWRLRHYAYPHAWLAPLHECVPFYHRLPWELRAPLQDLMISFLDSKKWRPSGGYEEVTDAQKIVIAAHACLLLLNRENAGTYLRALTIYLYPTHYAQSSPVPEPPSSTVAMLWQENQNLAIDATDLPPPLLHAGRTALPTATRDLLTLRHATWARLVFPDYTHATPSEHLPLELHSSDAMSTFVVATELFFQSPSLLASHHPALYQSLQKFYKMDPLRWIV